MQVGKIILMSYLVLLGACNQIAPAAGDAVPVADAKKTELSSRSAAAVNSQEVEGVASHEGEVDSRTLRDSYRECVASGDGSTWKMQGCIEEEFEYQDGKLNAVYQELLSKLPNEQRERLRKSERQWLSDKDVACKWDANTEGQAQRIDANVCSLKMTAERVVELEKQLKELESL